MPNRGPIPANIDPFNGYIIVAIPYLDTNKVRLKIQALRMTKLTGDLTDWGPLYITYNDDSLRTDTTVDDLAKLKQTITDELREVYGDLPDSELTTDDRNALNLPLPDKEPTDAEVMDRAPKVAVDKVIHLQHTLRITDPANPSTQEMPENQKVLLEHAVGEAGLTGDKIPFSNAEVVSRFLNKVNFAEDQKGKTAYYRARYVNSTGKQGPPSNVISEIII